MKYRLDLNDDPRVAASFQKCCAALKFDLAMLPLFISYEADGSPAYITPEGIWIHEKVLIQDPDNVHVYLAHEIFHWVVNNYSILNKFTNMMVNYITDFKINELLYILFGFNVKKVKFKGLLNKKWFGKSLHEIGLAILREDLIEQETCSAEGVPHPLIGECASMLRHRFKDHLEATQEVFRLTVDEERAFSEALKSVDRSKLNFKTVPLDKYVLLKALWYCFWHKQPFAMRPDGVLPPEHQFIFSVRWPQGMITVGRDIDALWAATKLMKALDDDPGYRMERARRGRELLDSASKAMTSATGLRAIRKLKRKMKRAQKIIDKWTQAKPLAVLLREDTIRLKQGTETRTRPRTMFSSLTETTDVLLPQVRVNDAVKRIRLLVRKPMRNILETVDSMDEIQESMGDLFTNAQEAEETVVPEIIEKPEEPDTEVPEPKVKPQAPGIFEEDYDEEKCKEGSADTGNEGDENGEEENEEEGEESEPENGEDKEDAADTGETGETDVEAKDKVDPGELEMEQPSEEKSKENNKPKEEIDDAVEAAMSKAEGGSGKDNGDFGRRRMSVMSAMKLNNGKVNRILSYMAEAETLIKQLQKQKTKIGQEGPDATYEYGNALANMAPEEVAFLRQANTKLAFLVKYATHQLLQRAPLESKKQPVVFMLDQSGSMFSGSMYERAAGFCLAAMKYLMKEKRGVSFTVFDAAHGREVHADVNDKIDIIRILEIIISPSMGGTCFQAAFERAQDIRDYFKWKSFTGLCITDGADHFMYPQKILENMKPRDKFIGAIVSKNTGESLAVVCEEIRHIHDRSLAELVYAAKAIF